MTAAMEGTDQNGQAPARESDQIRQSFVEEAQSTRASGGGPADQALQSVEEAADYYSVGVIYNSKNGNGRCILANAAPSPTKKLRGPIGEISLPCTPTMA